MPATARAKRLGVGACLFVVIAVLVAVLPSIAGADPAGGPFATIAGTAPAGTNALFPAVFSAANPLAGPETNVIARVSVSGLSESDAFVDPDLENCVGGDPFQPYAGEIVWGPWAGQPSGLPAGYTPSVGVCPPGNTEPTVSVELFEAPSAPASFTGATFLDPEYGAYGDVRPAGSELDFVVPGLAQYVAKVTLSSGAISLTGGDGQAQTLSSSGQVSLGSLDAGVNSVTVGPEAGPLAQWTVAIDPVPVVLSAVKFSAQYARAGVSETLGYSLDGDATISATIANASGVVVRSLATGLAVPNGGASSLTWDGRSASGNPVPNGTYTAKLVSTDPVGNVSDGTATIVIDSTPPVVSLVSKKLKPRQAVLVRLKDALSGVASGTATFDNGHTSVLERGQLEIEYGPSSGWTPGKHTVVVIATDRAGNRVKRTLTFSVAGLSLGQVTAAVNKILATSPSIAQDHYHVVDCQAVGQTVFEGHPGSLWQCSLASDLPIAGTTVYAVVVGNTLYLDRTRP